MQTNNVPDYGQSNDDSNNYFEMIYRGCKESQLKKSSSISDFSRLKQEASPQERAHGFISLDSSQVFTSHSASICQLQVGVSVSKQFLCLNIQTRNILESYYFVSHSGEVGMRDSHLPLQLLLHLSVKKVSQIPFSLIILVN